MLHLFCNTVEQRISDSLADTLRLEATQISASLERYAWHAESLASSPVASFLVAWETAVRYPESIAEAADKTKTADEATDNGTGVVTTLNSSSEDTEPGTERFDELTQTLLSAAAANRSEIVQLAIVDRRGQRIAATEEFTWEPVDNTLIIESMSAAATRFGDAFVEPRWGERRLGMVTPVSSPTGAIVGALLLESRLGPVIDMVSIYNDLASTSESHIVQRSPHGDAAFITPLRFDDDAAFNRVVPASAGQPANAALESLQSRVIRAPDYRGTYSILALRTLPETGWGIVVKIDAVEALKPVQELRAAAVMTTAATVLGVLIAWLWLLNPLGIRLKRTAMAAERIARGNLNTFVGDKKADEIGDVARTIDRLATDLKDDRLRRSEVESRLRYQATHDELTGLHNREHAKAVIASLSETPDEPASIVFMDLDGFKSINDRFGHAAGDDVLIELARRLELAIGMQATLARWGGDEFVVILPNTNSEHAARGVREIRKIFNSPFNTPAGPQPLDCSIGLSTSSPERRLSQVLSLADREMYAEKFHRQSETSIEAHAARTVERALDEQRVELWLQPIACVPAPGEVRLAGAEALVRVRSLNGAVISPDEFLPDVRKSPMGRALDSFMIERAVRSLSNWRRIGLVENKFRLAVNVTGTSLRDPQLASSVAATLNRYGVPPERLVIEISEKTGDITMPILESLRATGVKIALDDVGLHYNNLDRLVAIAPDVAKLDRQWMNDEVVLPRLIDLCQSLGLELVAEGVETEQQLTRLQSLAVTHFQGYLFDEPLPAVQFIERWGRFNGSRDTTVEQLPTRSLVI